jgi:hypothetical protein
MENCGEDDPLVRIDFGDAGSQKTPVTIPNGQPEAFALR